MESEAQLCSSVLDLLLNANPRHARTYAQIETLEVALASLDKVRMQEALFQGDSLMQLWNWKRLGNSLQEGVGQEALKHGND